MNEKQLISKIRELRQIKPRQDWVVLTKKNILGEELAYRGRASVSSLLETFWKAFRLKLVFAPVLAVFVLIGLFSFSHYSLPGDFLYTFKKVIEKGQAVFVSAEEKPKYDLEMVNKRLEELNKIAETNQVKNIAPALNEFKKTRAVAKKSVSSSLKGKSEKEAIKIAKQVAPELNEINVKEEKVLAALGIDSEGNENGNGNASTDKIVIELLLKDVEKSNLTEQQTDDLTKVKNYYENGDYAKALEFYLTSSLNPNYGK